QACRAFGRALLLARAGPARLGDLALLGDGELARRHVARDGRARADGRALSDGDRRHQLHVGADLHIVLDHGAVLVGAVVVAGDGAGADVDVASYRCVADVREVVRLAGAP